MALGKFISLRSISLDLSTYFKINFLCIDGMVFSTFSQRITEIRDGEDTLNHVALFTSHSSCEICEVFSKSLL